MADYTINQEVVEVIEPATVTLTLSQDDLRAIHGAIGVTVNAVHDSDGKVVYDAYDLYCSLADAMTDLNINGWSCKGAITLTAP